MIESVKAAGVPVKDGAIRAMVRRLADEGSLTKMPHGRYRAHQDDDDSVDFDWQATEGDGLDESEIPPSLSDADPPV